MAIVTPDVRQIDLGQGRGSSIQPADTYSRPQMDPSAGNQLAQLSKAMQALGVNVMDVGEQRAALQEQQDRLAFPYHADTVKKEWKDGVPAEVQTGQRHPDLSYTVRSLVNQKLGQDQAVEDALKIGEEYFSDPKRAYEPDAPEKFDAWLKTKTEEARAKIAGQPAYGAGYISKFDGAIQQIRQTFMSERAKYMEQQQNEALGRSVIERVGGAYKGAQVYWETAEKAADRLPNLINAGKAGGKTGKQVLTLSLPYAERMEAMLAAMPPELRDQIKLNSAFRTNEEQKAIFEKNGRNTKWAATPGNSNHEHGEAIDLSTKDGRARDFHKTEAGKWVHANAEKFGLYFPMKHEPWHIEMRGGRREGGDNRGGTKRTFDPGDGEDDLNAVDWVVDRIVNVPSVEGYGKNPNSSAVGVGQFVDGTWISEFRTQFPEMARGKTNEQILAYRSDPKVATELVKGFTQRNAKKLSDAGYDVTPANLYLMHFAGEGDAPKIIKASDGTKIESVMDAGSIKANPFLRGMTVGQVKEWAEGKMGGAVSGASAGQNALRATDREFARVSGLNNTARRDVMFKSIIDFATKTRDARFLDNFPPEYMTPQMQAEMINTRRQILDWTLAEQRQQSAEQERVRTEQKRQAMVEITELAAEGRYRDIDPRKYTQFPEVFEHARKTVEQGTAIPQAQSQFSQAQLFSDIQDAYYSGDFAKINPNWAGKVPTKQDLQTYIYQRPDMRPEEKLKLYNDLENAEKLKSLSTDPIIQQKWDKSLAAQAKTYDDTMLARIQKDVDGFTGVPFSYTAYLRDMYDAEVYQRLRAIAVDNKRAPTESEKVAVAKEVGELVKAEGDRMYKLRNGIEGSSPNANPSGEQKKTEAPAGGEQKKAEAAPQQSPSGIVAVREADGSITLSLAAQAAPVAAPVATESAVQAATGGEAATLPANPMTPASTAPGTPSEASIVDGPLPQYPVAMDPSLRQKGLMEKPMTKWTADDWGWIGDTLAGGVQATGEAARDGVISFVDMIRGMGARPAEPDNRQGIANTEQWSNPVFDAVNRTVDKVLGGETRTQEKGTTKKER